MLLGCIGDDFTGSSDLANTLAKAGMRTVQYSGVPDRPAGDDVEAGVVALKTRSIPIADAVGQSLAALDWLQAQGCRQFLFKYCSTFDSTREGNIGPVADALADRLGADCVIVCPVFPATGRTLYSGHLFVGDRLLSESGMENHPLTPMTDPDIRRWLQYQTVSKVGHVPIEIVGRGIAAVHAALRSEADAGRRLIVVDATLDEHLMTIGSAAGDLKLITGGSGIAMGLPENFRRAGMIGGERAAWSGEAGPAVVLSGSCSNATRAQVAHYIENHPHLEVTADAVMHGRLTGQSVASFLLEHAEEAPIAFSSADPAIVARMQDAFGREAVAEALEGLFAEVAREVTEAGVSRLIIAGGETSGAVVSGLSLEALEIGPEIDPGVPALKAAGRPLALALKSGNFGAEDFFEKAAGILKGA
jgi:uncharacterized protein YgbK (DUF1537 family)